MGNKILKTLTKNLGFKILAVVFAFILWLVVYNTDDPTITVSYTTNVTVENASTVTDMNKCYEVLNGTNTVSFAVTAKRSVLNKLEDTDFTAVADMNRMIVNEDGDKANVPIEITSKRSNSSLKYNGKNKYLEVSLEDLMKRRFIITADTSGKVADGYALGEVTVTNPNVLNVSGPASIVNKIDSVVATIDVDGMSMNLSDNVIPALYDADGQEIDTTKLKLSNTTVTIFAKILSVKEIPLVFSTSGVPYGDNRVVEISSKPETIKVKGSSTTLNPLSSLNIPGDVLNVSGASEDITTTIDISEYLPDGVELVNASVTVTVRIEAYELKKFNLSTSQINVNGLDSNYDLSFDQSTVAVTVSGLKNDLNKLNTRQLSASIDVTDLGVGTHQVNLDLNLDEDNYAYQTITVTIEIKDKTKNDSENTDDNSSENDSESEGQQDQNE